VTAQNSNLGSPYPANNTPLTLTSGTVLRQRDLVVFRGRHISSLTIVIETPAPASDSARVAQEAHEVANIHSEFAAAQRVSRIIVAVCRTQACLESRELPAEMFHFARSADGAWVSDRDHAR
jgi:hypothetical protein